jgi:hypothetical protein
MCDVVVHRGVYYRPYSGIVWLGNCNCFEQGFADDVVILISGTFLSFICDLMQRALNFVQNWCGEIRLKVNSDKTSMVFFTKRRNFEGFFVPKLFDMELILNNQVKYLVVIPDSKLNWKFHIDNRIRKASIAYWKCCRAIGKTWGLKPNMVYWIYSFSYMIYAALVWSYGHKKHIKSSRLLA